MADPSAPESVIRVITYHSDRYKEQTLQDLEALRECLDGWSVTWISVEGLGDVQTIARLADILDLHQLAVEDMVNPSASSITIIATMFIPLTFISGINVMNFQTERSPWNMPELAWYYGYTFALILMAAMAFGMLFYFRRKGWLGSPAEPLGKSEDRSAHADSGAKKTPPA